MPHVVEELSAIRDEIHRYGARAERTFRLLFLGLLAIASIAIGLLTVFVLVSSSRDSSLMAALSKLSPVIPVLCYTVWLCWKHRRLDRDIASDVRVVFLLVIASQVLGLSLNGLAGVPLTMACVAAAYALLPFRLALLYWISASALITLYGQVAPVDPAIYLRSIIGIVLLGGMLSVLARAQQQRRMGFDLSMSTMELAVARLAEQTGASESKWKMMEELVDGSPEGVAFIRDGRYAYVNRTFAGFSGSRTGDPVSGMLLASLGLEAGPIDLGPGAEAHWSELALRDASGQSRLFTATLRNGRYRDSDVVMCWLQEVTAERKAQREVELQALANERIIKSSPVGIGFVVGDEFRDGNAALLQVFDMHQGDSTSKFVHPDDRIRLAGVDPADWPRPEEIRIRDRDGQYRPCLVKGVRLIRDGAAGSVLWVVDLSEVRVAQEQAALAHQRLVGALDSLPVLICLTDPNDGILFANRRLTDLHPEFSALLAPGRRYGDYIRAIANRAGRDEAWVAAHIASRLNPTGDEQVTRTMGGNRWLMRSHHRLVDGSVISVGTDVTELKRAQEETQRAREAAEESARVRADFIANMSHEFRTPMNAIIGMCYLALQNDLEETTREHISRAHRAAQDLLAILNDILDFSELEAGRGRLEPMDFRLGDLLGSVASLAGSRAREKSLEFHVCISPDVTPVVRADAARLKQVLMNLCDNAVKFTERGSIGVVVSQPGAFGDEVELQFCIRDTGIGISPDQQAHLFEGFAQVDASLTRRFGGTGVGLGLANRIVRLMSGRIWVESTPGAGSAFFFTVRAGLSSPQAASAVLPGEPDPPALAPLAPAAGASAAQTLESGPSEARAQDEGRRAVLCRELSELRRLLEDGDARANERWLSMSALAPGNRHARDMARLLESYDFEGAVVALDDWTRELESGTDPCPGPSVARGAVPPAC